MKNNSRACDELNNKAVAVKLIRIAQCLFHRTSVSFYALLAIRSRRQCNANRQTERVRCRARERERQNEGKGSYLVSQCDCVGISIPVWVRWVFCVAANIALSQLAAHIHLCGSFICRAAVCPVRACVSILLSFFSSQFAAAAFQKENNIRFNVHFEACARCSFSARPAWALHFGLASVEQYFLLFFFVLHNLADVVHFVVFLSLGDPSNWH